jgi:hypothetical protein
MAACIVPLYHQFIGTVCATSLVANDDTYKSCCVAGDYDGDLDGFTTN